jgi:hypothetical protein
VSINVPFNPQFFYSHLGIFLPISSGENFIAQLINFLLVNFYILFVHLWHNFIILFVFIGFSLKFGYFGVIIGVVGIFLP